MIVTGTEIGSLWIVISWACCNWCCSCEWWDIWCIWDDGTLLVIWGKLKLWDVVTTETEFERCIWLLFELLWMMWCWICGFWRICVWCSVLWGCIWFCDCCKTPEEPAETELNFIWPILKWKSTFFTHQWHNAVEFLAFHQLSVILDGASSCDAAYFLSQQMFSRIFHKKNFVLPCVRDDERLDDLEHKLRLKFAEL